MKHPITMATPMSTTLISARTAGILYLANIGLGLFGEVFVRGSLVVAGDATATTANILGSQLLWRVGIVTDLVMHVLDVPLIVFFYLLLRPVSHPLALLATVFNVVQTCVLVTNKLALVAALYALNASVIAANKLGAHALALLAVDLHGAGFGVGLIFFGFVCLVRGWLIVKSGFMPRVLGALLGLAGLSYLVNSLALLLVPSLAKMLFPAVLFPAFFAELALSLWLVFANGARMKQLATQSLTISAKK